MGHMGHSLGKAAATVLDPGGFTGMGGPHGLDLGKHGAMDAAGQAAQLQSQAALAGIDEQRRQFDATSQRMMPFLQAGTGALPGVIGASTAGGLDDRLSAIMNGSAFPQLLKQRTDAVSNQLGQSGLLRSGAALRAAAQTPTDLALALEQELFGRQSGLVTSGQNAAAGLGVYGSNQANAITELLRRQGEAGAQGDIAQAQIAAGRTSNLLNLGTAAASFFFSDPRLKENMEPIGKIGPLTLYEWDWKPSIADFMGSQMTLGFDAEEVKEHFPHHIVPTRTGFLAIDYPALTAELRALHAN